MHDGSFNDIQMWKYHELPKIFGDGISFYVKTEKDLEKALKEASENRNKLIFIEVNLDRFDCSENLKRLSHILKSRGKT